MPLHSVVVVVVVVVAVVDVLVVEVFVVDDNQAACHCRTRRVV